MTFLKPVEIKTNSFTINTWQVGSGNPLLVVHGGPGLSHDYMIESNIDVFDTNRAIFFDQPGCGLNSIDPVSLDTTLLQFSELAKGQFRGKPGIVLAHSWGCNLVILAHNKYQCIPRESTIVFVCPAPTSQVLNAAAVERLMSRLPSGYSDRIALLVADGSEKAGTDLMSLAMTAYCAPDRKLPKHKFSYRMNTFNRLTSDLGDYALSADSLVDFSVRLSIIVGEYDFTVPSDYRIISEIANSCSEIKASGHFPNLESPSEYINILRSLLRQ